MPSVVDEFGIAATPLGAVHLSDEQVSRTVDLMILRFRRHGVLFRDIARIMGRDEGVVCRRYNDIPEDRRRYYASVELE